MPEPEPTHATERAPNGLDERTKIGWRVFLRVKNEAKARKLVSRIEAALGLALQEVALEPSDEDSALYELNFSTPYRRTASSRVNS